MPEVIPDDLPYTPRGIECLRLGARRGGEGIGCCAIDVFQGFSNEPSAVRPPIPLFEGDSRLPIRRYIDDEYRQVTAEGTNEEVFLTYLKVGTMSNDPLADHGFIAVLSGEQLLTSTGQAWLRILHREGFKWVGATSNAVYAEYHPNHIFMLLRSTRDFMDESEIEELQRPPSFWTSLGEPEETPEERFWKLPSAFKTYLKKGE